MPGTTCIGGVNDKVAGCTQTVTDQETIKLGGDISIKCIETPLCVTLHLPRCLPLFLLSNSTMACSHTQGHICFFCEEPGSSDKLVFTGDTLFVSGCGRCVADSQPVCLSPSADPSPYAGASLEHPARCMQPLSASLPSCRQRRRCVCVRVHVYASPLIGKLPAGLVWSRVHRQELGVRSNSRCVLIVMCVRACVRACGAAQWWR